MSSRISKLLITFLDLYIMWIFDHKKSSSHCRKSLLAKNNTDQNGSLIRKECH